MQHLPQVEVTETILSKSKSRGRKRAFQIVAVVIFVAMAFPLSAHASPFDTGFNNLQTLFTGTIAKVGSLIAIVLGGIGFATGDPGAKKNLAGVAIGVGIAVMAVNILSWLWTS